MRSDNRCARTKLCLAQRKRPQASGHRLVHRQFAPGFSASSHLGGSLRSCPKTTDALAALGPTALCSGNDRTGLTFLIFIKTRFSKLKPGILNLATWAQFVLIHILNKEHGEQQKNVLTWYCSKAFVCHKNITRDKHTTIIKIQNLRSQFYRRLKNLGQNCVKTCYFKEFTLKLNLDIHIKFLRKSKIEP